MPTRLPDFTFTANPMFGYIPMDQALVPGPTFYQGETAAFSVFLSIDATPVSLCAYTLVFVVKKSVEAENTLIRTPILEKDSAVPEGFFSVDIPSQVTSELLPGTYHYAFIASCKASGRVFFLSQGTFNIELSPASPQPNLTPQDGELTADGESVGALSKVSPAETTGPDSPDIGRITF